MAATPSKTQVDAANRQLQGMHQQLVDQEAKFKVVLNEKEEEIVRLHQLMEQLEMKFTAKLEAATAQAEVAEAEAVGKSIAKDNEVQILRQTLEQIATLATAAGFDSMVGDTGELFSQTSIGMDGNGGSKPTFSIVDDGTF